jgi:hypothetical protein
MWDIARSMESLWNSLVRLYDDAQFASETLPEADQGEIRKNTDAAAATLVANSGLNWECGPEVLDRFRAARTRAFRGLRLGRPAQTAGFPRYHRRLDHIAIPHRFTGGGASVQSLYSNRAHRFALAPVAAQSYERCTEPRDSCQWRRTSTAVNPPASAVTDPEQCGMTHRARTFQRATTGTFRVGDEMIRFRTVLHRAVPPDAVVKKVMWLGDNHPTRGWQWSIAITVEQMPPLLATHPGGVAALDWGWRAMEGYVRIGMLYDGRHFYELRCPLDMPSYHSRRHGLASSYYALIELDRRTAENVENAKSSLVAILPSEVDEEIAWVGNPAAFQRMRQGGLARLLDYFRAHSDAYGDDVVKLLAAWDMENRRLRSMRAALFDRLVARRRWLYRNLAAWLTSNFAIIARKSPLGIKQMLEDRQPDAENRYALDAARRYHQWTAVSELMSHLEHAAAKKGSKLIAVDPFHTTRRCAECGELILQKTAKLVLTCPNGHAFDQDANAARNIFSKMMERAEHSEHLRRSVEGWDTKQWVVPDVLRSVAVEVLPE